jgi:hypothetical protein
LEETPYLNKNCAIEGEEFEKLQEELAKDGRWGRMSLEPELRVSLLRLRITELKSNFERRAKEIREEANDMM